MNLRFFVGGPCQLVGHQDGGFGPQLPFVRTDVRTVGFVRSQQLSVNRSKKEEEQQAIGASGVAQAAVRLFGHRPLLLL